MKVKELIFGIGALLRERVSGWSTTDGGQNRVYPDHPPLDLSGSSYPRGTVDTISHSPMVSTIDGKVIIGTALVDVTAYDTNSKEVNELVGSSATAISQYSDGSSDGTATDFASGADYLPDWDFIETRNLGPIIAEETEKGFTRYNKTFEVSFSYIDDDGVSPESVGDTEIGAITDIDSFREVPTTETKYVSDTDEAPHITTHQPDDERIIISTVLSEGIHSSGDSLKTQKDAIDALTETDPADNRFEFKDWDGWLGVSMVQFFRGQTGYLEAQIDAIYLKKEDYQSWSQFTV